MIGDKLAPVNKKWWYALAIAVVALIPAYYLLKLIFVKATLATYHQPQIIYATPAKQALQILDKKIFSLGHNAYSGFMKIKNINLEWGVASQEYVAQFKTLGGTVLAKVNGISFILPSSEKLLVFSRFTSEQKPEVVEVILSDSHFIHKPEVSFNYELERVNVQNNADGLVVSAGIKNTTAFGIKQINLPMAVYNNKNEIVAVNFTYINDVGSGETRTFQYAWPVNVPGAVRAEISPEINIFDRNIFSTEAGVSPFQNQ